jgi:hypothetical protein
MKYIITCISHGRHENLQKIFDNFGTKEIIFFVKDNTDKVNYENNGAKKVLISGSLMESRNAALKYAFDLGSVCVQLSDDLEKVTLNDFTGKRTGQTVTAKEALDDIMPVFLQSKYYFAGFPPTDNPFFALKEFEENKFIVGDFILIKPCNLQFDENMRLKEDYDYTLQHIKFFGGCLRFGKYLNTFKHYSNKGGAVDYRTSSLEKETIEYLKNKWKDCIKLNPKRENEILLNKNSYKILNSKQETLF